MARGQGRCSHRPAPSPPAPLISGALHWGRGAVPCSQTAAGAVLCRGKRLGPCGRAARSSPLPWPRAPATSSSQPLLLAHPHPTALTLAGAAQPQHPTASSHAAPSLPSRTCAPMCAPWRAHARGTGWRAGADSGRALTHARACSLSNAMPFPSKTLYSALFASAASLVFTPRRSPVLAHRLLKEILRRSASGVTLQPAPSRFPESRGRSQGTAGGGCRIWHITAPAKQPWDEAALSPVVPGRGGLAGRQQGALQQTARQLAPRGQPAGHRCSPSSPAAHHAWCKVGAASKAGSEQRAGRTLGTAITFATSTRMSPGWHPPCPRRDCAPRMASLGEEEAAAPLVSGLVRGKGKRLGGKSTFLSLGFFFLPLKAKIFLGFS